VRTESRLNKASAQHACHISKAAHIPTNTHQSYAFFVGICRSINAQCFLQGRNGGVWQLEIFTKYWRE